VDEEDFALIEQDLVSLAEALGAPDAVDDPLFRRRDVESGIERAMPRLERVREKIRALERVAALIDRRTFETTMEAIGAAADRGRPREGSRYVPESALVLGDNGEPVIDLGALPDLSEIRSSLRRLANSLEDEQWLR
jgi:hypothetical protein